MKKLLIWLMLSSSVFADTNPLLEPLVPVEPKESRMERCFWFFIPRKSDSSFEVGGKIFVLTTIAVTIYGISLGENKGSKHED